MRTRSLSGNREISGVVQGGRPMDRIGKAPAEADDARPGGVRLVHSTRETGEQGGAARGGAGGGKGWDREECGHAKQGPGAEPGSLVPGAGTHTRSSSKEPTGKADDAPAPCHAGSPRRRVPPLAQGRGPGGGWCDLGGL